MSEVVTPIVHSNGTSREELLDLRREALASLATARAALRAMYPHPRDYYVGPDGMYEAARAQHDQRLASLEAVEESISAEVVELMVVRS